MYFIPDNTPTRVSYFEIRASSPNNEWCHPTIIRDIIHVRLQWTLCSSLPHRYFYLEKEKNSHSLTSSRVRHYSRKSLETVKKKKRDKTAENEALHKVSQNCLANTIRKQTVWNPNRYNRERNGARFNTTHIHFSLAIVIRNDQSLRRDEGKVTELNIIASPPLSPPPPAAPVC